MIGSHNSFSYAGVPWWAHLFNIWGKCQSKNIVIQLKKGVRYFDIRIRPNDINHIYHGIIPYKINAYAIMSFLEAYGRHTDIYVRFLLEYNKAPKNKEQVEKEAADIVNKLLTNTPHVHFCGLIPKYDDLRMIDVSNRSVVPIEVNHDHYMTASIKNWKWLYIPWIYAKLHNRKTLENNKELINSKEKVLFMDFI